MTTSLADPARNPFRRLLLVGALLLAGLVSATSGADRPSRKLEVALARSCFPNVDLNDATAAYRVFLKNIGRGRGYEVAPELTIYEDTPQLATAIQQGTFHLAAMDAWQFLDLERLPALRPFFVAIIDGQVGRRYVVLARRGSGFRTLADLRGRAVVWLDGVNNGVCRHWLELLLADDPTHAAVTFFATLERAAKPTAAVLPVYFGQKDACIVDEDSFKLMKELNPQVGNTLEVVAISDRYVDAIICLGEQNWITPEIRADTIDALRHLAGDPAGRQVLTLFRISDLIAFKEEHLATVRALERNVIARQSGVGRPLEIPASSPGRVDKERGR